MKVMLKGIDKILAAGVVALGGIAAFTSCSKKAESTSTASSGIATIVCDASFENIMAQEIDVFEYVYPDANIIPYYTDQNAAIDSLLDFKTRLIVTTRPLTEQEVKFLKSNKKQVRQSQIAVDALALIVNPKNAINVMSKAEIAQILSGKLQKWNEVEPGNDHLGDIEVVFDHQGSSTVQYMRDSLLNGADFGPNVFAQKTPEDVFKAVANNKNAVGIVGVSWISSDLKSKELSREDYVKSVQNNDSTEISFSNDVKVLKVRGNDQVTAYLPYQYYIFNGEYPLYRQVYMISTGAGGSLSHGFYSFVTGFHGQKIMLNTGILPKVVQPTMVNIN